MSKVEQYIASLERVVHETDGAESINVLCRKANSILGRIYPDRDKVKIIVGRDLAYDITGNEYYIKQDPNQPY